MGKYYLGIFCKDWADEFDYIEHFISTEDEKRYYDEMVEKYGEHEVTYYFGTNEGWEDVTISEMDDALSWKEISETTYNELCSVLGGFNIVMNLIEELEDYDWD